MQFKTLVLTAGLICASMASAENDPYLWLEVVDDEKALACRLALAHTHLRTQLK